MYERVNIDMNQKSVKPRNPTPTLQWEESYTFTYLSTKACPNLRSFLLFQDMACIVIMSPRPVKKYFVHTHSKNILCQYVYKYNFIIMCISIH